MKVSFLRVPLINNQSPKINFGFASNMALILWCVFGGLLLHMFLSNYLTMLMKPNYQKPINTAEDILDRGLTMIYPPWYESIVEILKNSPNRITRELAYITYIPKVIFCYIYICCCDVLKIFPNDRIGKISTIQLMI